MRCSEPSESHNVFIETEVPGCSAESSSVTPDSRAAGAASALSKDAIAFSDLLWSMHLTNLPLTRGLNEDRYSKYSSM